MSWGMFFAGLAVLQAFALCLDLFHADGNFKERVRLLLTGWGVFLLDVGPRQLFWRVLKAPLMLKRPVGVAFFLRAVANFYVPLLILVLWEQLSRGLVFPQLQRDFWGTIAGGLIFSGVYLLGALWVVVPGILPLRYLVFAFWRNPKQRTWVGWGHKIVAPLCVAAGAFTVLPLFLFGIWLAFSVAAFCLYWVLRLILLPMLNGASSPKVSPFTFTAALLNLVLLAVKLIQEFLLQLLPGVPPGV